MQTPSLLTPIGKVAASAAITHDNKILLLRRSSNAKLFPNCWTFPSGGIEETDPSTEHAVIREVKEETSLDFKPSEKFRFYESVAGNKRHFALVHLGSWKGEIRTQDAEISEYKWCSYNQARKLKLAFAYKQVIEDLKKQKIIK